MTGAYLIAVRNGERIPVEVEHLTLEELQEKFAHRTPEELVSWINMLCQKIRELEPLLDELERNGIITRKRESDSDE